MNAGGCRGSVLLLPRQPSLSRQPQSWGARGSYAAPAPMAHLATPWILDYRLTESLCVTAPLLAFIFNLKFHVKEKLNDSDGHR